MTISDFQPNTKKFYIIHSRDPILLLTKKQSWKVEQNNAAIKSYIKLKESTNNLLGKIGGNSELTLKLKCTANDTYELSHSD